MRKKPCAAHSGKTCGLPFGNGENHAALPEDPMQAFRESGYLERVTQERGEKNRGASASYA